MPKAHVQEVTESLRLPVPKEWLDVDNEDVTRGLLWWSLVGSLVRMRGEGRLQAISPLRNVEINVIRDADDAENLRALLSVLQAPEEIEKMIELSKRSLAARDAPAAIAVCVITYDALARIVPDPQPEVSS